MVIENRITNLYPEADVIFNNDTENLFIVLPKNINKSEFKKDIRKDLSYNGLYYKELKIISI